MTKNNKTPSTKKKVSKTQPKKVAPKKEEKKIAPKKHHLEANKLSSSAKSSMVTRIISSIIGLIIIIPALFLGDWIYFGLITLVLALACWEILGVAKKRTFLMYIIYFLFVALFTYWPIFRNFIISEGKSAIGTYFDKLHISILVTIVGIFLMFLLVVMYKDFTVTDATFLFTMAILIGFGFQALFYLRYSPVNGFKIDIPSWTYTFENTVKPSMLLLFVVVSTFLTDIGAYFVGIFFGKNKMNERISPKKTWEGFVGGLVISFALSSAIGIGLSATEIPLADNLRLNSWYYILLLSFLIPLFATLGDFVFSSIKRHYGIKDYGKLIPGHGGVLDRLDSVLFACIVASIFVFMLTVSTNPDFSWDKILI